MYKTNLWWRKRWNSWFCENTRFQLHDAYYCGSSQQIEKEKKWRGNRKCRRKKWVSQGTFFGFFKNLPLFHGIQEIDLLFVNCFPVSEFFRQINNSTWKKELSFAFVFAKSKKDKSLHFLQGWKENLTSGWKNSKSSKPRFLYDLFNNRYF